MKKQIKQGLVGILAGVGALAGSANGDTLKIKATSSCPESIIYNRHLDGATEYYEDSLDSEFLESTMITPRINFYSNNPNSIPNKLDTDSRALENPLVIPPIPESMTTFSNEFEGVGLSEDTNVNVSYWTNGSFPNFNVISRLTDGSDNTIQVYDAKQLAINHPYPATAFSIYVNNGITKKLKTEFYDTADVNIDGVVNLKDYAIVLKNQGNIVSQSDTYDANNFADIDRNGIVDNADLDEVVNQWLLEKE
ncbi:MAG: hypothetical protein WC438_05360 [Candidatus Pacearchaeota archaeon]